jgi:hypothetical protein
MASQVITQLLPVTPPAGAPSPAAVYWLNSSANRTVDQSGNGQTLTSAGSWVFQTDILVTGMTGAYFDGTGGEWLYRSAEALRFAKYNSGGDGSYTLEYVVKSSSSKKGGTIMDCGGSGESLATNFLYRVGHGTTTPYQFNERDNGVNINVSYTGATEIYDQIYYGCFTSNVAGTLKRFYQNGIKVSEVTVQAAEKNTSGNTQRFQIGRDYGNGTNYRFLGNMYSIRLTYGEYTEDQVAEAYASILGDPITIQRVPPEHDATNQDTAVWEDDLSHQYDPHIEPNAGDTEGALDQKPGRRPDTASDYGSQGAWEDDLTYETDTHVKPGLQPHHPSDQWQSTEAWEDDLRHVLSRAASVGAGTVDANGHDHFLANHRIMWDGFLYEAHLDIWANPTAYSDFTGYAKDGYHYTNGVKDNPDDLAPWATETESNYRGPRQDFPDRVWIASDLGYDGSDSCELVIFDLDQYDGTAASLHMWMRFISHSSRYFLQTDYDDYRHSDMKNGVLAIAVQQDTAVGSVNIVDFKLDGTQNAFHHFRTDGHWNLLAGKDITDRNSTSWWNGLSTPVTHSESYYRVAVTKGTPDNEYWVVACGEDSQDPITIHMENGVAQSLIQLYGDNVGTSNLNDYWYRNVVIDDNDMLWWSQNTYIFGGAAYYKDGALLGLYEDRYSSGSRLMPSVNLGTQVYWLTESRGFLYAATYYGVYKIDKNTLDYWLCYTVSGGGGGGRLNEPPAGEILIGAVQRPYKIYAFDIYETGFLTVCTHFYGQDSHDLDERGGMACVIRTYDDKVVASWQHGETASDLTNDGAYIALPLVRKS